MSTKLFYRNQLRLLGLLCLMATLSLFSCQDQEIPIEQVVAEEVETAIPDDAVVLGRARTPEAAIAEAIDAMEALEAINHTGAKSNRRVGDITAVRNPEFGAKGNDLPDTMMYIVNFTDNMGYALVSADYRTSTIYALASEGSIDLSDDANEPPALAVFHANAGAYYQQEIQTFNKKLIKSDCIRDEDGNPVIFPKVITTKQGAWEIMQNLEPMIPVRWGQDEPYNDNAPILSNGKHAAAGCVATAIAQVMAYHRYPNYYNWDEILKYKNIRDNSQSTTTSKTEIAQLFRTIGDNVYMQWGSQSGALVSDAPVHFQKMGYSHSGIYQDYDLNKIRVSLSNNCPVIIGGSSKMTCITYKRWIFFGKEKKICAVTGGGHAWVIDGVLIRRRKIDIYADGVLSDSYYEYERLVHCNWGWSGSSNGYYKSAVFNTNTGAIISTSKGKKDGTDGYYQFELEVLLDIKP
ncbi:MAG: C10 family peptidase [Bacteroidales bacterium]|nr:C10 family peptidase [Bacteroidales bacterium]